jgi:hypothetical protein
MTEQDPNRFYVYAYLRSKDSDHGKRLTPYYIGKGQGNRAFFPHQRRIPTPKDKEFIAFVQEGLTEGEAFGLERYCIAAYGRISTNTGVLLNLTDGGEGPSGFRFSDELKARMSIAQRSSMTQERKNKISRAKLGQKHSLKTKEKMSESKRGHGVSPETRSKISRTLEGHLHSPERRAALSRAKSQYLYELTDPEGEIYVTESITEFARQCNLSQGNLSNVVHGKRKSHKGWTGRILEKLK